MLIVFDYNYKSIILKYSTPIIHLNGPIHYHWLWASCAHHRLWSAVLHDTNIGAIVRLRTCVKRTNLVKRCRMYVTDAALYRPTSALLRLECSIDCISFSVLN